MPLALKASIKIQLCLARQLDAVTVAIAMEQSTSQIIVKLVGLLNPTDLFRGSRIHPTPNKCMTIAKAHRYKANYFFLFAGK